MTAPTLQINKTFEPITRSTLRRYADASGDTNAAHTDINAAKAAGFDDVFAQGMLVMAYMGSAVTDVVPPDHIRSLSTRFVGITELGDELVCTGTAGNPYMEAGEMRATIELEMKNQVGELKLAGHAIYALQSKETK